MQTIIPTPNRQLIGHRGVAGLRPENTYTSFRYAAELGLNWIEFDVTLTADDFWIVMHDANLERTTTGQGLVRDYTLLELSKFEAGLWFRPAYPNEPIPTLYGTLQLAQELNLFCNIELKNTEDDPIKNANLISDFIIKNHNLVHEHILLSSFDLDCLIAVRARLPETPIGYLIEEFTPDTIEIAQKNNFNTINCDVVKMTLNDLNEAKSANIPVFLYTINDRVTSSLWLNKGITAIFTDRPDLL